MRPGAQILSLVSTSKAKKKRRPGRRERTRQAEINREVQTYMKEDWRPDGEIRCPIIQQARIRDYLRSLIKIEKSPETRPALAPFDPDEIMDQYIRSLHNFRRAFQLVLPVSTQQWVGQPHILKRRRSCG
ncbi:hypothetical protein MSAN_00193500 [Mycena sanguinolenta]|uniref:Uncharacterized protein n=1 Tax=Mycena sanguinolenta TaxID=230812 RepID=A0A8H6ZLJ7_9AGAR|nr:hypothetical protein MSAN_00193500 [Mycena sanguinolenta]